MSTKYYDLIFALLVETFLTNCTNIKWYKHFTEGIKFTTSCHPVHIAPLPWSRPWVACNSNSAVRVSVK